jgi:hypothetical protein
MKRIQYTGASSLNYDSVIGRSWSPGESDSFDDATGTALVAAGNFADVTSLFAASQGSTSGGVAATTAGRVNAQQYMASGQQFFDQPNWRAAVKAALGAKLAPAIHLIIGHSHMTGQGAGLDTGGPGLVAAKRRNYASRLAVLMQQRLGVSSRASGFIGNGNTVAATAATYDVYDPEAVLNTWTIGSYEGIGGSPFVSSTTANAAGFAYTPNDAWDTAVILVPANNTASAVQPSVGGANIGATFDNAGAAGGSTKLVTVKATNIQRQTLTLTNTAANQAKISGAYFYPSDDPGIITLTAGQCGASVQNFVGGNAVSASGYASRIAPKLVTIEVDTNDINAGQTPSAHVFYLTTLVNAYLAAGADVQVVCGFVSSNAAWTSGIAQLVIDAIMAFCQTKSVNCYVLYNFLGTTFAQETASGYTFDANHPSSLGHSVVTEVIYSASTKYL